jgi:hypothetical protein
MLEAVLVLAAAVVDVFRPRRSLLTEIALLRHQLAILRRSVARPHVTRFDRIALVALAAVTPTWRNVLRIVQPETLLRSHGAGFKALWRCLCAGSSRRPHQVPLDIASRRFWRRVMNDSMIFTGKPRR